MLTMNRFAALCGLFLGLCSPSFAEGDVLSVETPQLFAAKAGATVEAKLLLKLREGYHVNSNTPSDKYLIPLRLTWNPSPLEPGEVIFPKPRMEKYTFSPTPLSVFSGTFELIAPFKVPAAASAGPANVTGKLRYQACNDHMCLTPKSLDVSLRIAIVR